MMIIIYRPVGHFNPFCLQYIIYHNIIQTLKDVTLYNDLNLFIGLNILYIVNTISIRPNT